MNFRLYLTFIVFLFLSLRAQAIDVPSTVAALKMRNAITGGLMSVSDPQFTKMVELIQRGDKIGAARIAAFSPHFASTLARRLALQMQSPALDTAGMSDNDATTFLVAHFVGSPGLPARISTIWSENATYYVVRPNGALAHAASLSANELAAVDWTNLVRDGGQLATGVFIPVKHVGGYTTLSDRANDNSFAQFGLTAGTNLRMIEGIWEIATGLEITDVASGSGTVQQVPRFVPEYDPNFFHGQGQRACISCHGGGFSSLDHGYATVANVFDFTGQGLTFISNPTANTMKSLGSDPGQRRNNLTCNLARTPTPVCNPESLDADPNQGWDVSRTWSQTGVLNTLGWQGPTTGYGLQELGFAIGKSWIVYQFLTKRIIGEICPLGTFSTTEINRIAALANPWAEPAGSDDVRTIVAEVAASAGCQ